MQTALFCLFYINFNPEDIMQRSKKTSRINFRLISFIFICLLAIGVLIMGAVFVGLGVKEYSRMVQFTNIKKNLFMVSPMFTVGIFTMFGAIMASIALALLKDRILHRTSNAIISLSENPF